MSVHVRMVFLFKMEGLFVWLWIFSFHLKMTCEAFFMSLTCHALNSFCSVFRLIFSIFAIIKNVMVFPAYAPLLIFLGQILRHLVGRI